MKKTLKQVETINIQEKMRIQSVYISKVISGDPDLLAVVFYGTEKDKNSVNLKNINVLQELDNLGAKRILELDHRQKRFQELMGHGSGYSLSEVSWVYANLFSDVQFKMSHKRIMLFTSEDNACGNNSAKASQMHLKNKDIDIISIAEDEDLRVHFEESGKLEDLLKQALSRLKLKISKDTVISADIYNLVQKALKLPPIKFYQETNEPVKTKTWTFNTSTGSLLLSSDTKRSQIYGMSSDYTGERGNRRPLVMLKKHHYPRPSPFVDPEESLVIGSSTLFSALLIKYLVKEVAALCRYTPQRNIPPYFVALVPQDEELDDQKIQVTPPGFQLVFLPFADDTRKMKLCFTYRSDSFENPVLQQHFRNLEALALDLMEPEQAVDLTLPKIEAMNKRLGSLVDEFKELVYPPDYNPEGKVTKRKHDNEGSGSKSPKVEYSEEELKTHISKGTLGKFTVPIVYGLKSGLKSRSCWKPSPSPSRT
uniref:Ku domain-containing protein n=1 Tax=Saimiri boliviensis boliviensis TaxID=39432 RepID=A0A2K6TT99_SAIBB